MTTPARLERIRRAIARACRRLARAIARTLRRLTDAWGRWIDGHPYPFAPPPPPPRRLPREPLPDDATEAELRERLDNPLTEAEVHEYLSREYGGDREKGL